MRRHRGGYTRLSGRRAEREKGTMAHIVGSRGAAEWIENALRSFEWKGRMAEYDAFRKTRNSGRIGSGSVNGMGWVESGVGSKTCLGTESSFAGRECVAEHRWRWVELKFSVFCKSIRQYFIERAAYPKIKP